MNKTDKTLQECFKLFDVAYKVTNNPNNVYLATKSVIQDFDDDNVVYLELRTTPRAEKGSYLYLNIFYNAIFYRYD